MFHLQYQCICCSKLFNIPRNAPRPNRNARLVPKFLEKHDFRSAPAIPNNEIIRFTDEYLKNYIETRSQWKLGDDEWDDYEIEKLTSLAKCECDSDMVRVTENLQFEIRCQNCGSSRYQAINIGISD